MRSAEYPSSFMLYLFSFFGLLHGGIKPHAYYPLLLTVLQ